MRYPLPFVSVAILFLTADPGGIPAAPLAVGDRHPDFTLPTITDGRPISLSDYRGKKVLLIQFASW
jgi:hypothetical protein